MHKLQLLHPPQPVGCFAFPPRPFGFKLHGIRGGQVRALETWQAEDPKILPTREM